MSIKLTKDSRFDIYCGDKTNPQYFDHKNQSLQDMAKFLWECEQMFGTKWEPIYLGKSNKITLPEFYHMVYTFKKHNYIVALPGELYREPFRDKELKGTSSIVLEMEQSNYRAKQEKKRIKEVVNAKS